MLLLLDHVLGLWAHLHLSSPRADCTLDVGTPKPEGQQRVTIWNVGVEPKLGLVGWSVCVNVWGPGQHRTEPGVGRGSWGPGTSTPCGCPISVRSSKVTLNSEFIPGFASHSSHLAWRIPGTEEPGRLQFMGLQRVEHDWMTDTFTFHYRQTEHILTVSELDFYLFSI